MGNTNSQVCPGVGIIPPAPRGSDNQKSSDTELDVQPQRPTVQQQQQHKPLVRRTSSKRGYNVRSASLRRMRSIQRRRLLEGASSNSKSRPSRRTARMEAENKKRQEEKHLLYACARGDLKKVEKLVDSGVDVNSADQNQMNALHYAAMHARDDVIKSLISRGAEVNTADLKGGFTAMHWVVINADPQYGSTDHIDKCLSALVRAGCKVNATDFNFATPLHIAAQKGNKGCVQTLMRLGADPTKVDITGRNSIEVAKDEQTKALLKRLHEKYSGRERSPRERSPVYQVLEAPPPPPISTHNPPPTVPAPPPPPVPPPRLVTVGKSNSEDHIYNTPEVNPSPPSSPFMRPSSSTPPPPPPRRQRQYAQYCNDPHIYHVLEVSAHRPRAGNRQHSPPRRRKSRKYRN